MPLQGSAAMLLSFDVDAEVVQEHDRWHTHEHLPERLSIPGFCQGTRWVALGDGPRYMVLYEVESLATLGSQAYLDRLNQPTPWTTRMMPHYRGMSRGLCRVAASLGYGRGGVAALLRFRLPQGAAAQGLRGWLLESALAPLPSAAGIGSVHLLEGAQEAAMTNEQRIRGADRGMDSAIILTGYEADAVDAQAQGLAGGLAARGAIEVTRALYRQHYALNRAETRG
ncbi:MAG TPA: hypothetical protein PKD73_18745 [Burkholderiaceae bacterium]|nr:hypothetical protein [Burkholderiaceae bacterium]